MNTVITNMFMLYECHVLLIINSGGSREHVTFVACGNAAGNVIPPGIIYQGKRMQEEQKQGGPSGAVYFATDSAYMVEEKMVLWLEHFDRYNLKYLLIPCIVYVIHHDSMHIHIISYLHSLI